MLPTDSYQKKGGKELLFLNPILSIYNRCFRIYERYWARKIEKIEELSFSYDLFLHSRTKFSSVFIETFA